MLSTGQDSLTLLHSTALLLAWLLPALYLPRHVLTLTLTTGAGSTDFIRFVRKYYNPEHSSRLPSEKINRPFLEKVWDWVCAHPDIRITHNGQVCSFSLPEFEAAERSGKPQPSIPSSITTTSNSETAFTQKVQPADSLLALRAELHQRLDKEKSAINADVSVNHSNDEFRSKPRAGTEAEVESENTSSKELPWTRRPRTYPQSNTNNNTTEAIFDESSLKTTAPRLFASQNRIWQALTGHGIDLKKVPSMEFSLLSIIAAHGSAGLTQPELTQLSNQDKRSVPKRTDELARKGYIIKNPVQSGKIRTSIIVHSKFHSHSHFLSTGAVEDVFQKGTFVVAGFAHLLYNKLKDAGVVPTRDIRKRLDVPLTTWNKRAVQGALIRLDQTGMIKRSRIRKTLTEDSWIMCIQVLREPQADDIENLGFRRQVGNGDHPDELLEDDMDGDTLMRDLEADMLEDGDDEEPRRDFDENARLTPQWDPDRLLANLIFDTVTLGQVSGTDGVTLRNCIVGPFWKRPMEQYMTRISDDWERTQPRHLRHRAIIRDTRTTDEKRFIHYVYRTYGYFQQAVDVGEAVWEGIGSKGGSKQGRVMKNMDKDLPLNAWGFPDLDKKSFMHVDGTASLQQVTSSIVNRRNGPRWDQALAEEIGYQKRGRRGPTISTVRRLFSSNNGGNGNASQSSSIQKITKNPTITLTLEERTALGLQPTGRIRNHVIEQILAHRRQTGDETSLPDKITDEVVLPKQAPLMTMEERIAANLPAKGRLGLKVENRIRKERGMPTLPKKRKTAVTRPSEPTVLTKKQRIALGLNPNGRLHQGFIDALREERENNVPLEKSPAVKAYLAALKGEEWSNPNAKNSETSEPGSRLDDIPEAAAAPSSMMNDGDPSNVPLDGTQADGVDFRLPVPEGMKRKAGQNSLSPSPSKKQRIEASLQEPTANVASPLSTATYEPTHAQKVSLNNSEGAADSTFQTEQLAAPTDLLNVPSLPDDAHGAVTARPEVYDESCEDNHLMRAEPGLYIYRSAKRKIGRGRPRKAFIAVFRFDQLHQLQWFKAESQTLPPKSQTPPKSRDPDQLQPDRLQPETYVGSPGMVSEDQEHNIQTHSQLIQQDSPPVAEASIPAQEEQVPQESTSFPTISSPVQSPSLENSRSMSVIPSQDLDSSGPATPGIEDTGTLPFPIDNDDSLPQGVVGPVAEVTGIQKSKAKNLGGSQAKFRQEIIKEIINLCDGVFPLHGEIWRPFSTLWDTKYGHTNIKKPINTTVFDTLKNMINNPAHGLKRMAFYIKARNAAGARERVIVARKEIPPNDPRVTQLAYNMANFAKDKSHQFYPEQIRHLLDFTTFYVPSQEAPKDESLIYDQLYPDLEENIKENMIRRRKEKAIQKKLEKAAAKAQNARVEEVLPRRRKNVTAPLHEKRTRLASLNDKNKRYRRVAALAPTSEELEAQQTRSPSPAGSDSSEDIPLVSLRPWTRHAAGQATEGMISGVDDQVEENGSLIPTESLSRPFLAFEYAHVCFTHPVIQFHLSTGTFSTGFSLPRLPQKAASDARYLQDGETIGTPIRKKRVGIEELMEDHPRTRLRPANAYRNRALDSEFIYSSAEDSNDTSSEEEEEEEEALQNPKKRKRVYRKRQVGKNGPLPTLLERLTGLTGDPNDPIYQEPKRQEPTKLWASQKQKSGIKTKKGRQVGDIIDPVDKFKKLCCTLALASSMSGEAGSVVWSIVEKVYNGDKFFDISKTKRLWSWLRLNRSAQCSELIKTFQNAFLEAYEECRLPEIEDPDVYDWAGVVRWVMRTCPYPEMPLPFYREALKDFAVDESNHAVLRRETWFGKKIADTTRTQVQLRQHFGAPLHQCCSPSWSPKDNVLKARSWTRANIATPQAMYKANEAHDKLGTLGEKVLVQVVGDYVQQENLRMRKIKRQLPGRNYTFTKRFAKRYVRPFELDDFMRAVQVKKLLDIAFLQGEVEKRYYSISRCEDDAVIMAIMSLASDNKVKLVPQLPHVNNEFGAPLPRLSKWGLCEGDYVHRAMDRNRLFWDIHVVPTPEYQFGNPLRPLKTQPSTHDSEIIQWPELPEPPLPGRTDPDALLPIWSTMDGQTVTWPWWYRILNLVIQPLYLQPGSTVVDVYSHCPEHTTEIFEVELVLGWLEAVGAVIKINGDRYQVTPNFWAVFGDRLLDSQDDWFGETIKRKTKATTKQQWRDRYNMRFSALQEHNVQSGNKGNISSETPGVDAQNSDDGLGRQITSNAKAQYSLVRASLLESTPSRGDGDSTGVPEQILSADEPQPIHGHASLQGVDADRMDVDDVQEQCVQPTMDKEDEVMKDAVASGDADADSEGDDQDAEGEIDDAML